MQKYYKGFFENVANLNAVNMKNMINYEEDESVTNVNISDLQTKVFIFYIKLLKPMFENYLNQRKP